MNNIKIVIPARRNSKGLPFKNRTLISKTVDIIPINLREKVIVSTDDEYIIDFCKQNNLRYHIRDSELSLDSTSTKDVIQDLINNKILKIEDNIIMLYVTYPERTWKNVVDMYEYFIYNNCTSLLTKHNVTVHPCLMMFEDNNRGKQIFKHNLYRRQDYPKVFEISHYVCIFKGYELKNLNYNLYNDNTCFYKLEKKIDVDTKEDLDKYERESKNNC